MPELADSSDEENLDVDDEEEYIDVHDGADTMSFHCDDDDADDVDVDDDPFNVNNDEVDTANEILARQVLDLVSTRQLTQKGCDLAMKIFGQYNEAVEGENEGMPTSYYMVKKLADARSSLLDNAEDTS